ncbi:MAG: ATP-dependent DNA ligase [Saprospiraceae bacterium]|nr:ATP-dependent DNA ligase [Saprospiraceae bacterium]
MYHITKLFQALDQTTSTNAKVNALAAYFEEASDSDKVWTIAMLSHRRPPRAVNYRLLGEWAAEEAGLPDWLFAESYHVVGDLAETIAMLIPERKRRSKPQSLTEYMELMIRLKGEDETTQKSEVIKVWRSLNKQERFIFNKLITGGLRVGVSQKLMVRALARHTGMDENKIALRLMGKWNPAETTFEELVLADNAEDDLSRPYPFYLAYALDVDPKQLGDLSDWQAERKWDGIRGQIIVRQGRIYVWSRGEELVTDKYPEFESLASILPDGTVLDGEILAYKDGKPLPFQAMQRRIGRKNLARKHLQEIPVRMIAYDLLEWDGKDIREHTLLQRRTLLENMIREHLVQDILILSPVVEAASWEHLEKERMLAREHYCEGLMLKRKDSVYQVGRKRGDWWKWKVDPYSVDAVMIYAQRGHGRRANMYTDFTFAVWDDDKLVSFAKAYSGLKNEEFEEITRWVRRNTIERFGPVSVVPAVHVFELHFEGIARSSRHKSGIAVRFPRIHRWRKDKSPEEADTLSMLEGLLD